ncbi:T9SS type A sorting domain-containing protein, partial [Psychroserpens sp. AS72]|uniref:T9SS type A sorting domain-containing protein n=1 Tax=Psychroserpens sp. AS72 TaxID=3135775 RepID=UPI0031738E71
TICEGDSYNWLVDGMDYTVADSPVVLNLNDSNGCPYTATLTITEDDAPNAGEDAILTVCADVVPTNEDLFDALLGTPNEGGTWSGPLADVYTYTFAASGSCPEVSATVTLAYYEVTGDISDTQTVCDGGSYTWSIDTDSDGISEDYLVDSATTETFNVTDENGCPFDLVLTLAYYDVTLDDQVSGEVCVGNTYEYEGIEYTVGSYDIPKTDTNGCPYKTVLTVSAYEVTPDDVASGEVCVGNTYEYEGTQYAVGSYDIPKTDSNGCPYTTVLTVTAYEVTEDIVNNVTICEGDSYNWLVDGMDYTVADSPVVLNLNDSNGCPYTATLTITEDDAPNAGEDAILTVCADVVPTNEDLFDALLGTPNEGGTWSGPLADVYTYTFAASGSCPEVSATVKVEYYDVTPDDAATGEVCIGNTYNYEGIEYAVGSYDIPRTDANGCPYKTVLTVSAYDVTPDNTASGEVCVGNTYEYEGTQYAVGSYDIQRTDANGCPYTTVLTVTAFDVTENIETEISICKDDSYLWSITNEIYTAADSPVVVNLSDANGCPYIATLIINEDTVQDAGEDGTLTVCQDIIPTNEELFEALGGDPDVGGIWSGPIDGVYKYVFEASGSCGEASATVTVDYYDVTPDVTVDGEVCYGQTFTYNGIEYGLGTHYITNIDDNGCPFSTIIKVTSTNGTPDDEASGMVCIGQTYMYQGEEYEVGVHTILQEGSDGCTYNTILTVTEYPKTEDVKVDVVICEGDTYNWTYDGNIYTAADSPVVIQTEDDNGCPYTVTLIIDEIPTANAGENGVVTVCMGTVPTNEELFEALGGNPDLGGVWSGPINGEYIYTIEGTNDCPGDSSIIKVYEYSKAKNIKEDVTICKEGSYLWPLSGETYTYEDSPVVLNLTNDNGCDYTATLVINQTELLSAGENSTLTICQGVVPSENELFAALEGSPDEGGAWSGPVNGDYIYTIPGTDSCPGSYAIVKVYYYEGTDDLIEEVNICEGESYYWPVDGNVYASKNSPVIAKMTDDNGCPYTATLIINVISTSNSFGHSSITACEKGGLVVLSGGTPEGGMYSGYGVVDNNDGTYSVNTNMLTPGIHAIIYTYGYGTNCAQIMKFKLEIIDCDNFRESSVKDVDFKAYPIPYSKEINIAYEFDFDTDVNIQVMDIRGMLLEEVNNKNYIKNSESVSQIDLSKANDQILFIKVSTNKGSVVKKIVPSNKRL